MGYNQLLPSNVGPLGPDEDEDEAGTDADMTDNHWWGWDEDGLYYLHEVRDNFRDIEDGGQRLGLVGAGILCPSTWICSTSATMARSGTCSLTWPRIRTLTAGPLSISTTTVEATFGAQEGEAVDGFEYGFRDAGSEFGGDADYVIEGTMPWESLMRWNLPDAPTGRICHGRGLYCRGSGRQRRPRRSDAVLGHNGR